MRQLVEQLAQRPYASEVFTFNSMVNFVLTTAPSYQEAKGHDEVWIGYNPGSGLFGLGYSRWVSPTRNPQHSDASSRVGEWPEVLDIVDHYVVRLLLVHRERPQAERRPAQDRPRD